MEDLSWVCVNTHTLQFYPNEAVSEKGLPVVARSGSLIGSSNNNDNNNQQLETIHNQANTKDLLCRTIKIRDNSQ